MPLLRSAFIALSHNRPLRRFCEHSRLGARLNSRFIAGMAPDDALRVAEDVNRQGIAVTLDSLGESVTSESEAHRAADVYHKLLDSIAARGLNANVSLKLTQMGLGAISGSGRVHRRQSRRTRPRHGKLRAHRHGGLAPDARSRSTSCAASMRAPATRGAVGVVIQAYLYRSQADVEQLLADGIRIRLCKGAYKEPPEVAYPRKADVDANFLKLSQMLLASPIYHGLATHDEAIVDAVKAYAAVARNRPRPFRVSNVIWSAPRSAAQSGARRLQGARLCSLWHGVVSLLYAPPG